MRFKELSTVTSPSIFPPPAAVPLPASPTSRSLSPVLDSPVPKSPLVEAVQVQPGRVLRKRVLNTEQYLRTRLAEDREGDEAGLLPLKIQAQKADGPNERDSLLGGARPGMGSAQLHEELGGQLADVSLLSGSRYSMTNGQMSHRLKLNAVHFANSLEDEKSLLDTSTEVLDSKLRLAHLRAEADESQRI